MNGWDFLNLSQWITFEFESLWRCRFLVDREVDPKWSWLTMGWSTVSIIPQSEQIPSYFNRGPIKSFWGEGNQGAAAAPRCATFISRQGGTLSWLNPHFKNKLIKMQYPKTGMGSISESDALIDAGLVAWRNHPPSSQIFLERRVRRDRPFFGSPYGYFCSAIESTRCMGCMT